MNFWGRCSNNHILLFWSVWCLIGEHVRIDQFQMRKLIFFVPFYFLLFRRLVYKFQIEDRIEIFRPIFFSGHTCVWRSRSFFAIFDRKMPISLEFLILMKFDRVINNFYDVFFLSIPVGLKEFFRYGYKDENCWYSLENCQQNHMCFGNKKYKSGIVKANNRKNYKSLNVPYYKIL